MERISWTDCVKSEVLQTNKEERNILHTLKQGKDLSHLAQEMSSKTCYRRRAKRDGKTSKKMYASI
jgi:hypothetical protein